MAANSTSYDLIADLLSTNNTIGVATLIGAFVFGVLAAYGCFLTWRHQQWERQLQHGAVSNSGDNLEAGCHAMRDLNNESDDGIAVEEDPDTTSTGTVSGSQLDRFMPTAEGKIAGSIGTEESISRERPQSSEHVYGLEGEAAASPTSTSDHEPYTIPKGSASVIKRV